MKLQTANDSIFYVNETFSKCFAYKQQDKLIFTMQETVVAPLL